MDPGFINSSNDILDSLEKDGLKNQDSFGRWMNYNMTDTDSPLVIDEPIGKETVRNPSSQSQSLEQIFNITEVSPSWASSKEETKVLFR